MINRFLNALKGTNLMHGLYFPEPTKTALVSVYENVNKSYGDLDREVNNLATNLNTKLGIDNTGLAVLCSLIKDFEVQRILKRCD